MRRSNLARRPSGNVVPKSFTLKGGLNLVDAPISMPPGMALAAVNYELQSRDGYRRVDGFERFDGQQAPSDANYWILRYDNHGVFPPMFEGILIEGSTSGASGTLLVDAVQEGGNIIGGDAYGYMVLINVDGTFQDGENLESLAIVKATADGTNVPRGADTPALDSTYIIDAFETQRALILTVGDALCTGPVRGVHTYEGVTYAFRDNVALTKCLMFKQSITGWTQIALGNRLHFTDGGAGVAYVAGEVITGTTSGASATISKVVLQSGAWGVDAVGYLIIGDVTAGPFQAEATTGSIAGAVPIDAAEIDNTPDNGGHYEFVNYNFYGTAGTKSMYGVNGVSEAFEFDGTIFTPIITGNTNDKPTHVEVSEYHLFLCFEKGSLQNSKTGDPLIWAGGGAGEIGTGDDLVGLKKEVGAAMGVFCRNRAFMLHGKNTADSPWDLKTLSDESGAIEWTIQRIGYTRYLDDRGFTRAEAVQAFGDFKDSTYSQLIEPLVLSKKQEVTATVIIKEKNQLRTFFTDGTGITTTFNDKKLSGFTTFNYTNSNDQAVVANCASNGESTAGDELIFIGGVDGYVYQVDKGPSFDGGPVAGTLVLAYNNLGSPSIDKQFKKVSIEAEGAAGAFIEYNVLLDYSSGRAPVGTTIQETLIAGGSLWNQAIWNQFSWAAEDVTQIEGNIDGVGRNIGLQISSLNTYIDPHTLYSTTYHYINRKLVR